VPVLWIWDNVEPVAGFPKGTPSAWTAAEQAELVSFLRELAAGTRARVLLTSRRDEQAWLGDLPARVGLPGLPMREAIQVTRARSTTPSGPDWPCCTCSRRRSTSTRWSRWAIPTRRRVCPSCTV